jgi:hypothetical protein
LLVVSLLGTGALKVSLQRRVDNHGFATDSHRLGVLRASLSRFRGTDLTRSLSQDVQAVEVGAIAKVPVTLAFPSCAGVFIRVALGQVGEFVEPEEHALAIAKRDGLALLDQVIGEAVDAALGEFLTAGLAGVLIAVAGILELGASDKELEDELVGLATHFERELEFGEEKGKHALQVKYHQRVQLLLATVSLVSSQVKSEDATNPNRAPRDSGSGGAK